MSPPFLLLGLQAAPATVTAPAAAPKAGRVTQQAAAQAGADREGGAEHDAGAPGKGQGCRRTPARGRGWGGLYMLYFRVLHISV